MGKNSLNILRMKLDSTGLRGAVDFILDRCSKKKGAYVCLSNVHMAMEVFDSREFEEVVNSADLVLPDGRPIFWAQSLSGASYAEQVRGVDLTHEVCKMATEKGLRVGLYGGSTQDELNSLQRILEQQFPNIEITYAFSPPFRKLQVIEDAEVTRDINFHQVDILFVGIGCPKQERWMWEHRESLTCVMLGVGAAFDYILGSKRQAPRWLQYLGFEWLFRFALEPGRLWKRYLVQSPRFLYYFCLQLLFGRSY